MCGPKPPKIPKPEENKARDPLLAADIFSGRLRARRLLGFTGTILGANPGEGTRASAPKTLLGH